MTISLPEELLAEIDKLAEECGQSRSMVVQEATARYVTQRLSDEAEDKRQADFDKAWAAIEEIRAMPVKDPRPTLEILREIRAESLGEEVPESDE